MKAVAIIFCIILSACATNYPTKSASRIITGCFALIGMCSVSDYTKGADQSDTEGEHVDLDAGDKTMQTKQDGTLEVTPK